MDEAQTEAGALSVTTGFQVIGSDYLLRYATHEDAPQLFDLASDPAVTRFFSWGPYTSIDQPLAYISSLEPKRVDGSLLEFVIVERATDKILGVTGLTEFSRRDHRAVVGSWLGHKYWGTGINQASKSLVLAMGFRKLGLGRISAYSHVRNGRSEAALERVGFRAEGILRAWHWHRGAPQDVNIHCMLHDQYQHTKFSSDPVEFVGEPPPAFVLDA
ncbi:MAG: GNAT family N-acetyltransferase [Thermoleophilaceae bacterium]|nr:GNAT family N-acetyltransferase [Thermoleophilaceae bacterium]